MMQLVVHAADDDTGRMRPAYRVLVRDTYAFVQPLEPRWAAEAQKVEVALSRRSAAQAQAMAVAMDLPPV